MSQNENQNTNQNPKENIETRSLNNQSPRSSHGGPTRPTKK